MKPNPIKTAFKPFTPKIDQRIAEKLAKPIIAPVIPKPAAESKVPAIKFKPCQISVILGIQNDSRDGMGAAFARVGTGHEIGIEINANRFITSRAIHCGDALVIRFIAAVLLGEFVTNSRFSRSADGVALRKGLLAILGGPWPHFTNISFIAAQLLKHPPTKLEGDLKLGMQQPWFSFECLMPSPSCAWQWNEALPRPIKQPENSKTEAAPL